MKQAVQKMAAVLGVFACLSSSSVGGFRRAQALVSVDWAVPNYLSTLVSYLGGGDQMNFAGTALSTFRQ